MTTVCQQGVTTFNLDIDLVPSLIETNPFMSLKERFSHPKIKRRLIISFAIIIAFIFGRLMYFEFTSHGVSSRKIIPEYNDLFTKEAQRKLNVPFVYESKYESLSCNYYYDNKYYLSVRKFLLTKNKPLEDLILVKNSRPLFTGGAFSENENDFLDEGFKPRRVDTIKTIQIYLEGESITTVTKNDSLVCYYLKVKSFYMYYNDSDSPDIKGEAKHDNTPVSLLFLKRNNMVYFFTMDIKKARQTMQPNLLYNLINK